MVLALLQKVGHMKAAFRSSLSSKPGCLNTRLGFVRWNSTEEYQRSIRNIGISAHIDSGKTTLTERILYYTGKINEMHEVKGKDMKGATMDFMELEREKGITIQSAATYCIWKDHNINIIDTPGHVDFTIEVERALRVLDGAVLVMCGVGGVQSQTLTVDRQMRRYNVPRLTFINKLDRAGADPWRGINQIRSKLGLNASAVQIPIGLEDRHRGLIDIIERKAYYFEGPKGDDIVETDEIPSDLVPLLEQKRKELLENLAEADEGIAEKVLEDKEITVPEIKKAIRKATIDLKFIPVFMGSAYKNKGVQKLLDGVLDYLPNPTEVKNYALDVSNGEAKVELSSDSSKPFVGLGFKLEEGKFGQLTYLRVYQGTITRGDMIINTASDKKVKVPRLVRMHANQMVEINEAKSGEICALFGVDCNSGTTFIKGNNKLVMTSMHVPSPVISLAVAPAKKDQSAAFGKALNRFQKEDPTFQVRTDPESHQTIISGMGELHLEIYIERMKREYGVDVISGKPEVAYRETILKRADFEYTHKKQSGGSGQYARVVGYMEPIDYKSENPNEFVNSIVGGAIPPEFIPACQKGFEECVNKGPLTGHKILGVRMVLNDGAWHSVDSNELAFRTATVYAFKDGFKKAGGTVLEPIMKVEVNSPAEFQGVIVSTLLKRKGMIQSTDVAGESVQVLAHVPLANMFGYSTDLRSITQGKGEFTMEYYEYNFTTKDQAEELSRQYKKKEEAANMTQSGKVK